MPGPSTVVLVRHAEPQTSGTNPGLTVAGRKRAELLGFMLQDAGVTAVFTSELRRTQETAQPLAARLSVVPTVLLGLDTATHRDRVLAVPSGVALVIGHTNTVPPLIAALGAGNTVQIAAHEFDRMFLVALRGAEGASILSLRYRME
jgi:phosphohistidine phosphatase SixA